LEVSAQLLVDWKAPTKSAQGHNQQVQRKLVTEGLGHKVLSRVVLRYGELLKQSTDQTGRGVK
jgi:hypothetical protein